MTYNTDLEGKIDSLTGIYNRQFWEEQLPLELERSQETKKPVSIVLLDLDWCNASQNDGGVEASEEFLCRVTQGWKRQLRRVDMLISYGKPNFGLILPGCEPGNAVRLLDRLRANIPNGETFSAGVATWNNRETCQELVNRSLDALERAKQGGKNQTAIAS